MQLSILIASNRTGLLACSRIAQACSWAGPNLEVIVRDNSAFDFMVLWLGLLSKSPQPCDFRRAIGANPADWFVATQCLPGVEWNPPTWKHAQQRSKGTLAHFESVFTSDASLARLRL